MNCPGGRLRIYEALTSQKNCLRILYFMYCASLAAWQPLLAVYFNEVGISGLQIGIIMSIAPIMVFLVQPMWGGFVLKKGKRNYTVRITSGVPRFFEHRIEHTFAAVGAIQY